MVTTWTRSGASQKAPAEPLGTTGPGNARRRRKKDRSELIRDMRRFTELRKPNPTPYQRLFGAVPYACAFLDLAFMKRGEHVANGGNRGFLCACEEHSNAIDAEPIKNKKLETLRTAMSKILNRGKLGPVVAVIADRETALKSPKFRGWLAKEHGVRMHFVSSRSKSFRSERAIRSVRTWLSKKMALAGSRNWVRFLPEVVDAHNAKKVKGTNFSPAEVDRENLSEFLRQKYGVGDWHALSVTHRLDADDMARPDLVFKFKEGELVAADRKMVGEVGEPGFDKKSARGYFSKKLYRIHKRVLATTKDLEGVQSE